MIFDDDWWWMLIFNEFTGKDILCVIFVSCGGDHFIIIIFTYFYSSRTFREGLPKPPTPSICLVSRITSKVLPVQLSDLAVDCEYSGRQVG